MAWKVNIEKGGKKDCLFYGEKTTDEDKDRRNQQLREQGYKILSCYKVKKI